MSDTPVTNSLRQASNPKFNLDERLDALSVTIELFPASRAERADAGAFSDPIEPCPFGRILGDRYSVESLLGRGGMGDVFEVSDRLRLLSDDRDQRLALKVLREPIDQNPEPLARLRHEFNCTRKLMHPNIVKVYDFEHDGSVAFYTMELLEGERLCDLIKRTGQSALPRNYAWAIIGAVGAALAHAHSRNVIHGDVSPKNVMITRRDELRVLDFGSSRASAEDAGTIAATPAYASCELLEGHQADPRDDIYSLACLACELLAGKHPFQGRRSTEARDLKMRPVRPQGVSSHQWRTLQRGLSWSREERPASIREWLANLDRRPEPDRLPPLDGADDSSRRAHFSPFMIKMALAISGIICTLLAGYLVRSTIPAITFAEPQADAPPSAADPTSPQSASLDGPPAALTSTALANVGATTAQSQRSGIAIASTPRAGKPIIKFTAQRYSVHPGTSFAEIHLWRSPASNDTRDFVWWTEDASARSGVDFVAQERASHGFAGASSMASVFVRILPNAARTQRASFQVCAGKPSGSALVEVTCSSVVLPGYSG